MIEEIVGNLLDSNTKYIAHQTSCMILESCSGVAKSIFNKYPYANCYDNKHIPGTIEVCGNEDHRLVINIFSQYYPGKANNSNDSELLRKQWFHNCLLEISKIEGLDSIAFPYMIGCGLAGGNWTWYYKQLNGFSDYVASKAKVFLYKLQ